MSPLNKKKLTIIRNKLDNLDNSLFKIIKQRTILVKKVLKLKDKKKQIIDNGLVSNELSKRNPIVVPTTTAAINSVLIFKAFPKDVTFELFFLGKLFLIFFFAISKRVVISLNSFIFLCH